MSERKHTPGPWRVGSDKSSVCTDLGDFADALKFGGSVTIRRICDCESEYYLPLAEVEANARLIAASPLMYDYIRAHAVAGCEQAAAILRAVEGTETT